MAIHTQSYIQSYLFLHGLVQYVRSCTPSYFIKIPLLSISIYSSLSLFDACSYIDYFSGIYKLYQFKEE